MLHSASSGRTHASDAYVSDAHARDARVSNAHAPDAYRKSHFCFGFTDSDVFIFQDTIFKLRFRLLSFYLPFY